jgi:hypothetical protein
MFRAGKVAGAFARGYILVSACMFVGGFFVTFLTLVGD